MWIHPQGGMNVGVRFHGKSVSFLQRDFTLNYTVPREEKGMNVCSRSGVSSNISVCTDGTITTSKTLTCWWSITKLFRIHPQYYNNPSSSCQDMSAKTKKSEPFRDHTDQTAASFRDHECPSKITQQSVRYCILAWTKADLPTLPSPEPRC